MCRGTRPTRLPRMGSTKRRPLSFRSRSRRSPCWRRSARCSKAEVTRYGRSNTVGLALAYGLHYQAVSPLPEERHMLTKFIIPAALAALMLGSPAPTIAQTADYQTYFTFSGPVTLPGVTLPAG